MPNKFIKSATKKSLLALTKKPLDARGWARLLETLVTKDELQSYADSVAGDTGADYVRTDGTTELTAGWDAGNYQIHAKTLKSDVPTGTAPLTVASTTKVTNLNADLVDGQTGTYYLDSDNFTGTEWTDLTDNGATTIHKHDHGGQDGLGDDDHASYLLASDATDRATFATNWEDLTDLGDTSLHTHTYDDSTVDQKFTLHEFTDVKQRLAVYSVHGGFDSLDTGSALDSVPTDIVATAGLGKILIVVNAGSDFDGEITVTGTTVDRNTGAETGADTDTLTIDALTTDNSSTDAEGNTVHEFVGAYITSKWFLGQFTLSTNNLTLTDVDTYQVSFDQMDDSPGITLQTFDMTVFANNQNAWLYAYLYTMHVTGDKCNIDTEATIELPASKVSADRRYRLKRGEINKSLNGETDGFWFEMFPGPLASTYWENIDSYIRGEITRTVTDGLPLTSTPNTTNWEEGTIGQSPTNTPMYSGETSTVRALIQESSVPTGLTKMVETITVAGNHIHNWRTASKYDISDGLRVEVVGQFPTPFSNADFYVGLSPVTTADDSFVGLPDHHIMALFRDDDNDFYQRYSLLDVDDWVTENQIDVSQNMTPGSWAHFQVEYKLDDDEIIAQYRQIWSGSAGGFKTLSMASAWEKPEFAYVFWGGLNNSSSFVRVANVWIGSLTDSWPYVGAP